MAFRVSGTIGRIRAVALAAAAVWAGVSAAAAEERLIAEAPQRWELVTRDISRLAKRFEFVPPGETAENWHEMISIQVLLGRSDISPKAAATEFRDQWEEVCRRFRGTEPDLFWDKDYLAARVLVECRDPEPGRAVLLPLEARMLKAIQGRDSFYVVQRAWRDARDGLGNPWFSPDTRRAWEDYMMEIELCDSRVSGQTCRALERLAPAQTQSQP